MLTLKDITQGLEGLNEEEIKGRLSFCLQYITEMIEFSKNEIKGLKEDKSFYTDRYTNNFEDNEMRKITTEGLEIVEDSLPECDKEIKHYTKLKEIVTNLLKETNG